MGPIPTAEPEVKKMYILFVKRMGRVKTSHDNVRILVSQAGNWRFEVIAMK